MEIEFDLGEIVYLRTDEEDVKFIVVGIVYCISGVIRYQLKNYDIISEHYAEEITTEKSIFRNE